MHCSSCTVPAAGRVEHGASFTEAPPRLLRAPPPQTLSLPRAFRSRLQWHCTAAAAVSGGCSRRLQRRQVYEEQREWLLSFVWIGRAVGLQRLTAWWASCARADLLSYLQV